MHCSTNKKVGKKEVWCISAGILSSNQCCHQHRQVLSAPLLDAEHLWVLQREGSIFLCLTLF